MSETTGFKVMLGRRRRASTFGMCIAPCVAHNFASARHVPHRNQLNRTDVFRCESEILSRLITCVLVAAGPRVSR